MRLIVAGPGRAGGSIVLAARQAGHEVVGVLSRRDGDDRFRLLAWDTPLPQADLLVLAVRDDAIGDIAERLAPLAGSVAAAVHLSGYTSVDALAPLAEAGLATGSFHPLQTLPTAEAGAAALAGSYVAITGRDTGPLFELAHSLQMRPFLLDDAAKAAYHAGAAAASNYVVSVLGVAADLFESAGVPFVVLRPLTEHIVANVFEMGAGDALTGPVARGDRSTVAGQIAAARAAGVGDDFVALAEITARRAGSERQLDGLW